MEGPIKGCWAAALGNCKGKLTGEHLVSNSILLPKVTVKGLPWCKDKELEIGSGSFTSNHLCKSHNEALSDCDAEVKNFVEVFKTFYENSMAFKENPGQFKTCPIRHTINGRLLEKWFCKTLINIACQNADGRELPIENLLPHIFEGRPFVKPYGLSYAVGDGQKFESQDSRIQITTLFEPGDNPRLLVGGLVTFRSQKLVVLFPTRVSPTVDGTLPLSSAHKDWAGLQLNWHNEHIQEPKYRGMMLFQVIDFTWN